ncbi:hypothetical protein BGZ83_005500, partial [Gryganskiella cystojenkinii]
QILLSNIEENLIATVAPLALNSAYGGYFYRYAPQRALKDAIDSISMATNVPRPQGAHDSSTTSMKRDIERVVRSGYNLFKSTVSNPKTLITPVALKEIVEDAQNIEMDVDRIFSVLVTKDIPLDALKGGCGYNSPTAGHAPHLEHHIRQL